MREQRFGLAWTLFAVALALHVFDEAAHDFLAFYNPMVRAIREALPFLPLPTFTFEVWISGLILGIVLLLALAPLAFRGNKWLVGIAWPLAIIVGILNGLGHIGGSLWFGRVLPGLFSAPVILTAGIFLLETARRVRR